jgi:hypothetical protein
LSLSFPLSPHVAGAVALYKAINPKASPSEVLDALVNLGSTPDTACDGNGHEYFTGGPTFRSSDPDGIPEPLLYLKDIDKYKKMELIIYVPLPVPYKIRITERPDIGVIPPPSPPPTIPQK